MQQQRRLRGGSTLALVPTPPAGSELIAPAEPQLVTYQAGEEVEIGLPRVVRLRGLVQVEGNYAESSVESVVTAVATQDLIPGVAVVQHANAAQGVGFELLLQAGVEYTFKVSIPGAARPAWRTTLTLDNDAEQLFELPKISDYPTVTGRIKRESDGMLLPLEGVQVTAIDPATKAQCTSDVTTKLGEYRLLCPLGPGSYEFQVSPTEDGPMIPSFVAVMNAADDMSAIPDPNSATGDRDMPDIVVPDVLETVDATVTLGESAANVAVIASATLPDIAGVWTNAVVRATGTADADGDVELSLVSCDGCTYDVTAAPSNSHAMSGATHTTWNLDESATLSMALKPKVTLTGEVLTAAGQPLAGAQIEALRVAVDSATKTTTTLHYTGESGEHGGFDLSLDPGTYDVTITPSIKSGLPRFRETGLEVGEAGHKLQAMLPPATLLEGTVLDPERGAPVEKVTVDVYHVPSDGTSPTLVGTGRSGADGRYLIILPAAL